jgi:hypothetical protein
MCVWKTRVHKDEGTRSTNQRKLAWLSMSAQLVPPAATEGFAYLAYKDECMTHCRTYAYKAQVATDIK